jgi:DNA-binding CsgD family transcriptional regulator
MRVVTDGEALLSPAITKRVIKQFARIPRPEPPLQLNELTEPELYVFRLIARGLSNAEIARELYISDTTVKTHITHRRASAVAGTGSAVRSHHSCRTWQPNLARGASSDALTSDWRPTLSPMGRPTA